MGKPKLGDVMKSVNTAIQDLTDSMNQRLSQMEGYCDTQIINLQKKLIHNNYRASFTLWSNCIKEYNAEEANKCQMDAIKSLVAQRPKFAPSDSTVMAGKPLSSMDRRTVEASLILFRDYANLVIMELTPLINKFCPEKNDRSQHNCKRFSKDMIDEVNFFIKYAQNAMKLINNFASNPKGNCPNNIQCGAQHPIKEGGWIKKHTCNTFMCKCVIEDSNSKKYCEVRGTIRVDQTRRLKHPWDEYYYPIYWYDWAGASRRFAGEKLTEKARIYNNRNRPIVHDYWAKTIEVMIPVWQTAVKNAEKTYSAAVVAVGDEELMDEEWDLEDDPLSWYDYSEGFEARRRKAGLKLDDDEE